MTATGGARDPIASLAEASVTWSSCAGEFHPIRTMPVHGETMTLSQMSGRRIAFCSDADEGEGGVPREP
jgi:hypothetical protein